jgi:SAM-dependent methyltransferase
MNMTVDSVLTLYQSMPRQVQLHVRGRWRLFPFDRLIEYIPSYGSLVDLGCGHGVWIFYLANIYPDLRLWGVDPDGDKIAIAQNIAIEKQIPNARFIVNDAESMRLPVCDLVSIIDVMYLIPYDAQVRVLEQVVNALRPSGKLLLKEMGEAPRWKFAWNWMEEWLAVRLLNITMGARFYFRPVREWEVLLQVFGLRVSTVRIDQGYLHPHVLLVGEKIQSCA